MVAVGGYRPVAGAAEVTAEAGTGAAAKVTARARDRGAADVAGAGGLQPPREASSRRPGRGRRKFDEPAPTVPEEAGTRRRQMAAGAAPRASGSSAALRALLVTLVPS